MKTLLLAFAAASTLVAGKAVLVPASSFAARAQEPIPAGPEHKLLQKGNGEWDAVLIMSDPDGKEVRTTGVLTSRAHTDYFVVEEFTADMMGQKFTGHGVHGYCPIRKQYFTHWTDSMSPTPLHAMGTYDEKSKTLTLKGECMGMSGKLEPHRIVTKFVDDDHTGFDLYGPGPDGKEAHMLHIDYTRKKAK